MKTRTRVVLGVGVVVIAGLAGVAWSAISLPPPDPESKAREGEKAPGFALAATTGGKIALADLARGRAAVLVFYRGDW